VLPGRYADKRLTDLLPGDLKQCATEYVDAFLERAGAGVAPLFLGRARTGKTTAAAAILRSVTQVYHVGALFCSVPSDFPRLEMTKYRPETEAEIRRLQEIPFLVLDDIGVVDPGTYGHQLLSRLVVDRFDALRPTLMTGNLTLPIGGEWERIAGLYGPLLARRLQECATGFTVLTE
jgi:DNA replication protein DnaC